MERDTLFEISPSRLRFGVGATREVGADLRTLGVRRALVLTDPTLAALAPVSSVLGSLADAGVDAELFSEVRVEPSDRSMTRAATVAVGGGFDGFVAVGGGSVIDTAKAANLLSTYPAPLMDYVNAPLGAGRPVPGPLKPLIAIPTTAGTGSEVTGVAVLELEGRQLKTGIAHPELRPTLGLIDPLNTATLPTTVAISAALDVLCHAMESYTAIPFTARPRPETPALRPTYQGSNPVSDLWALQAVRLVAEHLPSVVADRDDLAARTGLMYAATYAGMGFGSAGVHLPHAMSYPVAGRVRDYRHPEYPRDHALIPHGLSVIVTAPAVFRYTAKVCTERHADLLRALGVSSPPRQASDVGRALADRLIGLMHGLGLPSGLAALGYGDADLPALVEGTLAQQRLTALSPRWASPQTLSDLFLDAMAYW